MQHAAREQQYRAGHPAARFWIVLHEKRAVGRLIVDDAADPIVLVDLALLPEARGQGLGAALLSALAAAADAADRRLRLHVAATNPAQRLYRRAGFVERERTELVVTMERPARSEGAG
jgi:ribosomal protein S18 acetylase RimI-like enzyme